MSHPDPPSGVSPAAPQGRLVEGAGSLGGQAGWRGRAGRSVAYVVLTGAVLAALALVGGIVRLFR